MKKACMLAATIALLASCQSKPKNNVEEIDIFASDSAGIEEITEVYRGTLPAADGPGIDYILTLNAEINGADTLFSLDMIYLDAEGPGKNKKFNTKGKQQKIQKVINKHPKKAVKLTPHTGESPMYFLIVNDTTLRLTNDGLTQNDSTLSYDLIRMEYLP